MQSNKTSKKTTKIVSDAALDAPAAEAVKAPRRTKSSTSKPANSDAPVAAKTHRSAKSPEVVETPAAARPVSEEEIAALAHSYWQARGGQHGSHVEDWLRAERELAAAQTA